jgi:hypothetical protein
MVERTCITGKQCHDSQDGARTAARHTLHRHHSKEMNNIYKCGFCGFWHHGRSRRENK